MSFLCSLILVFNLRFVCPTLEALQLILNYMFLWLMRKNVFLCFNNSGKFIQTEERQFNISIFDNAFEFVINTKQKWMLNREVLLSIFYLFI